MNQVALTNQDLAQALIRLRIEDSVPIKPTGKERIQWGKYEWAKEPPATRIYFIQAGSGPIKIGISKNPMKRLLSLQIGIAEPLRLLATIPTTSMAGLALEKQLHRKFAHLRLRGEWFNATSELTDFIASHGRKAFLGS